MPAPVLMPHDMALFQRLKGKIDDGVRGVESAHAGLARASIIQQAAEAAMGTFMEHLAEMYGLKPQDIIDANGNIHLVDPGWAMEAARQRQMEAAQQGEEQEDVVEEAPAPYAEMEALPGETGPMAVPLDEEAAVATPDEEMRVIRIEEDEPVVLPPAPEPAPVAPLRTRKPRAH